MILNNGKDRGKREFTEKLRQLSLQAQERTAQSLARELSLEYQDLSTVSPQTQALKLIPEEQARQSFSAPFILKGKLVGLACKDPRLESTKRIIKQLEESNYQVKIFIVSENSLNIIWEGYKLVTGEKKEISGMVDIELERLKNLKKKFSNLKNIKESISEFESPYTSQLLEIILAGALAIDASDIHIEAEEKTSRLRYRIDGALNDISEISLNKYRSIVSRIKLLSEMKINIRNKPQDGRFTIKTDGEDIEIRVSIIPSAFGETIVLRVLNPESIKLDLEDLGFREDDLEIIEREIKRPNGIILNTGPTGSGKTTTLYAFLRRIYKPERKIITVEDPIEYHLKGITQTQIKEERGYTFASGLRSILRQDPDVILVGEIRDKETAGIAMQASLTGHLVLSTLHTNEAAGALPRLLDLEVEPGILSSALNLVIAQRLVRRLCPFCRKELILNEEYSNKIKNIINQLPDRVKKPKLEGRIKIFEASEQGCEKCGFMSFKGRIAITELLVIDPKIQVLINKKSEMTILELREFAIKQGMVIMLGDGILKILEGITTISEVEATLGKFL
jgi:type IV pilus assembly protein PilB